MSGAGGHSTSLLIAAVGVVQAARAANEGEERRAPQMQLLWVWREVRVLDGVQQVVALAHTEPPAHVGPFIDAPLPLHELFEQRRELAAAAGRARGALAGSICAAHVHAWRDLEDALRRVEATR